MNWYLATIVGLNVLSIGIAFAKHGEPRTGKHNFWANIAVSLLEIWLVVMAIRCGFPK